MSMPLLCYPSRACDPRDLHSFPTRRSSDLNASSTTRTMIRGPKKIILSRSPGRRGLTCLSFPRAPRSEEHTSELQSRGHLVCRLLLEKKKKSHISARRRCITYNANNTDN